MKTEQKRLAEIKRIYEEGAATFTHRTSNDAIHAHGGDLDNIRDRFLSYLPENASILDVGCGSGRDARYFIEHGCVLVGIDICESFIHDLAKNVPGTYVVGDFVDSEEAIYQNRYDGIWAYASIVHLHQEEAVQVMKNCFDTLNPGGCFFIMAKYTPENTHMEIKESKSIPGTLKQYLYYAENDITSSLESIGFLLLDVSLVKGIYGGDTFIRIFCKK